MGCSIGRYSSPFRRLRSCSKGGGRNTILSHPIALWDAFRLLLRRLGYGTSAHEKRGRQADRAKINLKIGIALEGRSVWGIWQT